jgi:hypothetical protein
MSHIVRLTAKQERVLVLLLSEPTIQEAAKKARVNERTLFRWLAEPAFAAAYRRARRAAVTKAVSRLQYAAAAAVGAVVRLMADGGVPPAVRLAAARTVLEMSLRGVALEDFEQRLCALEAAQDAPDPTGEEDEKPIVSNT